MLMPTPVDLDRALNILTLRVLGKSQDEVSSVVHCNKKMVGDVETWFGKELTYQDAKAFVDDQAIKRLVGRDIVHYGLDDETLERAHLVSGNNILRRFRTDYLRSAGGLGERLNPIEQQATIEKIETHWGNVLAILDDLQGIGVFDPNAREIRTWISRPNEPSWPVPKGMAHLIPDAGIQVTLFAEDRPEWELLKEHVAGHPLFVTIAAWKLATAKDITGRRSLLEWLLGQVKAELGLAVLLDGSSDVDGLPRLTSIYADHLFDQTFRRVSGLPTYSIDQDQLMVTNEGNVILHNEPLVVGCDKELQDSAIRLLIDGPNKFSKSPVAMTAGRAYRYADTTTQKLKSALANFIQLTGRTPDTRCEVCTPWFEELGVSPESP